MDSAVQAAIDILNSFWSQTGDPNFNDIIDSMKIVVEAGKDLPTRAEFAQQNVFTQALLVEPVRQDLINDILSNPIIASVLGSDYLHSPRWFLLNGIKNQAMPGFFSLGDPTGVGGWLGSVSASGGAMEYTISADPDPEVRAEAMDMLTKVSYPLEWSTLIKSGLDKLDETLPSSPFDQATRSVLAAQSRNLRARLYTVANIAASANFAKLTKTLQAPGDGSTATMPPPPPRPWYKRLELWAGAVGGAIAGARSAGRTGHGL